MNFTTNFPKLMSKLRPGPDLGPKLGLKRSGTGPEMFLGVKLG